jgi:hypothetical protein
MNDGGTEVGLRSIGRAARGQRHAAQHVQGSLLCVALVSGAAGCMESPCDTGWCRVTVAESHCAGQLQASGVCSGGTCWEGDERRCCTRWELELAGPPGAICHVSLDLPDGDSVAKDVVLRESSSCEGDVANEFLEFP